MTLDEFRAAHAANLKTFLESPSGQAALSFLGSLEPQDDPNPQIHLFHFGQGKKSGYRQCLRSLIGLTVVPTPKNDPQPNYGIVEKKEEGK